MRGRAWCTSARRRSREICRFRSPFPCRAGQDGGCGPGGAAVLIGLHPPLGRPPGARGSALRCGRGRRGLFPAGGWREVGERSLRLGGVGASGLLGAAGSPAELGARPSRRCRGSDGRISSTPFGNRQKWSRRRSELSVSSPTEEWTWTSCSICPSECGGAALLCLSAR